MKKKIAAVSLIVAVLAIALIGATMSYFNDTEVATNTFTMGDGVDIELSETSTADPDNGILAGEPVHEDPEDEDSPVTGYDFGEVLPGLVYSKVPVVTVAEDSSDCWLVATVTVNCRDLLYEVYADNAEVNHGTWLSLAGSAALISGGISDYTVYPCNYNGMTGNKLNDGTNDVAFIGYSEDEDENTITYTYYFFEKQEAGDEYTLFETVKIPTALTQEQVADWMEEHDAEEPTFDIVVKAYAIQEPGFADAYAAYQAAFAE